MTLEPVTAPTTETPSDRHILTGTLFRRRSSRVTLSSATCSSSCRRSQRSPISATISGSSFPIRTRLALARRSLRC